MDNLQKTLMSKNLFETIDLFVRQHTLLPHASTIIIGLSGGPDSIFLLHYLISKKNEYNLQLIAAHVDHGWRAESAIEMLFCKELCQKLGVPFETTKLSDVTLTPKKIKGSQEAYARNSRRTFFTQLQKKYSANSIALAHHVNDQEETFFIRLARGSSLTGLCAMQPKQDAYIRPLLQITKENIIQFLQEHTIQYLSDPSNQSNLFLRNRIRNILIPKLHECDPRFSYNIQKTISRLQNAEDYLQKQTLDTFTNITHIKDAHLYLNIQQFLTLHPELQYRVLLHFLIQNNMPHSPSERLLAEIIRFFANPHGGKHIINAHILVKKQNSVHIIKK